LEGGDESSVPERQFISEEGVARFLDCGHDGRRGYIHHLAVSKPYRCQGVGRALAGQCLSALRAAGIHKCHLFVFDDNQEAIAFWKKMGWTQRIELTVMSQYTANATSLLQPTC